MKKFQNVLACVALAVLCLLTYSNSLDNAFLLDDHEFLLSNTRLHDTKNLPAVFQIGRGDIFDSERNTNSFYFRPFAYVPVLSYQWFGSNPRGYHVLNLALFSTVCAAVFVLVYSLFGDFLIAFLTGALYAVHPLNGLFVNYVTASVFALQVLFLIASCICATAHLKTRKHITAAAAYFLFLLALFCHETSLMLPVYLMIIFRAIYDLRPKEIALRCLPYIMIGGLYLGWRLHFTAFGHFVSRGIMISGHSFAEYGATFFRIVTWYVSQFVFPRSIVLTWMSPLVEQNIWPRNAALIVLVIALVAGVRVMRIRKKHPRFMFGVLWLAAGFGPLPLACLLQRGQGLMIEPHWFFFSSIGGFFMMALWAAKMYKTLPGKIAVALLVVLFAGFSFLSRQYNHLWGNEQSYCRFWHRQAPSLKGPLVFLGASLMSEGRYDEAQRYFHEALGGTVDDWRIYNNLGLIGLYQENFEYAEENFRQALTLFPDSSVIYNNLGMVYLRNGDLDEAEQKFLQAMACNKSFLKARINLAEVYRRQEEYTKAENLYLENLRQVSRHAVTLFFLMDLYDHQGRQAQAVSVAQRILESRDADVLVRAGGFWARRQKNDLAENFYRKALSAAPRDPEVYLEWGRYLVHAGMCSDAVDVWERARKKFPGQKIFVEMIRQTNNSMDILCAQGRD